MQIDKPLKFNSEKVKMFASNNKIGKNIREDSK